MPTISQILAASFPSIVAASRRPENQWADSSLLSTLEEKGCIRKVAMGPTIEAPLDYRRTANAGFLATDLQATSLVKTDVITAASYTPGQLSAEIVWSKKDEATNSSENQKVDLVKSITTNALDTHDDLIEDALFDVSTDGFLGVGTLLTADGLGSPGGINAATDVWWKNQFDTYLANGSDIEAALTEMRNAAMKGSKSKRGVDLIFSGSAPHALYEAQLQAQIRYMDVKKGDAGFKALAFGTAPWVFSQHGGTAIFGINTKSFFLQVSKDAFRQKGEIMEIPNANGYVCKLYSLLQFITTNRSRGFRIAQV